VVASAGQHASNFPLCSAEAGKYDFNQPDQPHKPKPPSRFNAYRNPENYLANIPEENFVLLDLEK
jgi:hypothetical protein